MDSRIDREFIQEGIAALKRLYLQFQIRAKFSTGLEMRHESTGQRDSFAGLQVPSDPRGTISKAKQSKARTLIRSF